jgi:choline-sulfatase
MRDMEPYLHALGLDDVHETTGLHATVNCRSYMSDRWEGLGLYEAFRADYRTRAATTVRPSTLPVEEFADSYVGREAEAYLRRHDRAEPWCLFVGFGGPHEPWDAPGEYAMLYDPAATPPALAPLQPPAWAPPQAAEDMLGGRIPGLTDDVIRLLRANYFGKIALLDHWFGRLFQVCRDRGWWDDLLVVFWSDHGEMLGDHGYLHKQRFLEASARVPLVIRRPGRARAGCTTSVLVQQIDIMPTLLAAAGAPPPEVSLGRSLWPVLERGEAVRDAVLAELARGSLDARQYMVRTDRHKYAIDRAGRPLMLYDLREDPEERTNLAGRPDMQETEARLRDRLLRLLADAQPAMLSKEPRL